MTLTSRVVGRALRSPRGIRAGATGAAALQILFLAVSTASAAIPASSWDAAAECNDSANPDAANPSGVWSYGWKKTVDAKFYLALTHYNDPPDRFGWCNASGFPVINHTTRAVPAMMNGVNRAIFPPYALGMHPGLNGEYAVVRFTAPADGSYQLSGRFYALDDNGSGTTTDVWILAQNKKADALSGQINYHGGNNAFSFTGKVFQLKTGETLDFQVGYGADKNFEYDSTGLAALIEKIR